MALIQQQQPVVPDYLGTQLKKAQLANANAELQNYQNQQFKAGIDNQRLAQSNQDASAAMGGDNDALNRLYSSDPDRAKKIWDHHVEKNQAVGSAAATVTGAKAVDQPVTYKYLHDQIVNGKHPLLTAKDWEDSGLPDEFTPDVLPKLYAMQQQSRNIENAIKAPQEQATLADTVAGTGLKQAETKTQGTQQALNNAKVGTEGAIQRNYGATTLKTNLENNATIQEQQAAADAGLTPAAFKAQQAALGAQRAPKIVANKAMEAGLPQLLNNINKLSDLGQKATYTYGGQLWNFARTQTNQEPSEGQIARTQYDAVIKNQIIPLLKQTFPQRITNVDIKTLTDTLGDKNITPAEKDASLQSFISQKVNDVKSQRKELGMPEFNTTLPSEGKFSIQNGNLINNDEEKAKQGHQEGQTATNPKTGEKIIFKGGKWQKL